MTNDPRDNRHTRPPNASWPRFLGILMMAVGGLIAGLCGLCTLAFAASMLPDLSNGGNQVDQALGLLLVIGLFGVLPTAAGSWLFLAGLARYRRSEALPEKDLSTF